MMRQKQEYRNAISIICGILCLGVVYLHSSWVGGFDIYDWGTGSYILKQVSSLILMAIVPSFFIVWGYVSSKYLHSEESPRVFVYRKLIQFYPVYACFFLVSMLYRYDYFIQLPAWKTILGLSGFYYESGMGSGGNIYMVVLFVIITVAVLKKLRTQARGLFVYTAACLAMTKMLPHESELCYIQYFGYYAAFFLGASLRHAGFFEMNAGKGKLPAMIVIFSIGMGTPVLNFLGFKHLEIQYGPNSFEQIFFCTTAIFFLNMLIERVGFARSGSIPARFLHAVGNNAYGHFIIQSHIIKLVMFCGTTAMVNKVLTQIFVIAFTSYITVYWVLRYYKLLEARVLARALRAEAP